MEIARVTSKGRMTIPKTVRDRLGLRFGDLVELETDGARVVLTKVPSRDVEHLRALEESLGEWLSEADEIAYRDL